MNINNIVDFNRAFTELAGFAPLRWQCALHARFLANDLPDVVDLPTGVGKTSVIPIWLIAFAQQCERGDDIKDRLPRRLIYVVNRRTVVDQATTIVDTLRGKLEADVRGPMTQAIHDALARQRALGDGPVLGLSTLRGELADNEEWKYDMARPAIIVGTIPMIGSKLLFRGYGDSYKVRAHHAGLIGQDSLLIHDEAHLSQAFNKCVRSVIAMQQQQKDDNVHALRFMELSATPSNATKRVFNLEASKSTQGEPEDAIVTQRINAAKHLRIEIVDDEKKLIERVEDIAWRYQDGKKKILIYVERPTDVAKIASGLQKKLDKTGKDRVAVLTGTLRGYERDQLVKENRVYGLLLDSSASCNETVFLVSTSAGDVGIDLDADVCITTSAYLDQFSQRFGRVNRRGGVDKKGEIVVCALPEKAEKKTGSTASEPVPAKGKKSKKEKVKKVDLREIRRKNALQALQNLPPVADVPETYNASPRNMGMLLRNTSDATEPPPKMYELTPTTCDVWSLTSGWKPGPNCEEVEPYLNGVQDDIAETRFVWRDEMEHLIDLPDEMIEKWFDANPVRSRECVTLPTFGKEGSAQKLLEALSKERKTAKPLEKVLVRDASGTYKVIDLGDVDFKEFGSQGFAYALVILPTTAGGLNENGLTNATNIKPASDVANKVDSAGKRFMLSRTDDGWRAKRLGQDDMSELSDESVALDEACQQLVVEPGNRLTSIIALPAADGQDDPSRALVSVRSIPAKSGKPENYVQPTVDEHCEDAAKWAQQFAQKLGLSTTLSDACKAAAIRHDWGKARTIWQRSIFNNKPGVFYAKSGKRPMDPKVLAGYRHELGSLLQAMGDQTLDEAPEQRDLILHLIAMHHGWARPHFTEKGFDRERFSLAENQQAVLETLRRFEALQMRFGRWKLAWLESIIRNSDILSSQQREIANEED